MVVIDDFCEFRCWDIKCLADSNGSDFLLLNPTVDGDTRTISLFGELLYCQKVGSLERNYTFHVTQLYYRSEDAVNRDI